MTELVVGSLCILMLLLALNFPSGFRRLMARICFVDESAVPDYPVGAAVPLMLLLAWMAVVPGIVSIAGTTKVQAGIGSMFLLAAAVVFVLTGLILATWPEQLSQKLRWPPITSTIQAFVSRLVGAALLVGGAWLVRSVIG